MCSIIFERLLECHMHHVICGNFHRLINTHKNIITNWICAVFLLMVTWRSWTHSYYFLVVCGSLFVMDANVSGQIPSWVNYQHPRADRGPLYVSFCLRLSGLLLALRPCSISVKKTWKLFSDFFFLYSLVRQMARWIIWIIFSCSLNKYRGISGGRGFLTQLSFTLIIQPGRFYVFLYQQTDQ